MEDAGDAPGNVVVVARAETAEKLSDLPTRELAVRKAACDRVVDGRVRGFFGALNSWLIETVPQLGGLGRVVSDVVSVRSWELFAATGVVKCNCSVAVWNNYLQRTALIDALGRCGFDSMVQWPGEGKISLSIGADMLDKGFVAPPGVADAVGAGEAGAAVGPSAVAEGVAGKVRAAGHESDGELDALPMGDLLARRAAADDATVYDAAILAKGRGFFEKLNLYLPTVAPEFGGFCHVLTVEDWRSEGHGAVTYQCRLLDTISDYLKDVLLDFLVTLGLLSLRSDFARRHISLTFPADSLDVSGIGILLEGARAAAKAAYEKAAGQGARRLSPGTGGTGGTEVAYNGRR